MGHFGKFIKIEDTCMCLYFKELKIWEERERHLNSNDNKNLFKKRSLHGIRFSRHQDFLERLLTV